MVSIKDKLEYLVAFLIVAGGLFLGGVFMYHLINIMITTISIMITTMSTILYSIYLLIGCVFYKIGVLMLGF